MLLISFVQNAEDELSLSMGFEGSILSIVERKKNKMKLGSIMMVPPPL